MTEVTKDGFAVARTVGDLIAELQKLPADTVPISAEPPFAGVTVIPQDPAGKVFIASVRDHEAARAELN